jgi:hypothetical protein
MAIGGTHMIAIRNARRLRRTTMQVIGAYVASWNIWLLLTLEMSEHSSGIIPIGGIVMGRGILLWLLGIPLPIVILLVLFLR